MPAPDPSTTDWIIAVSGCFAAVGTVGAVCVALWQSTVTRRRSLDVSCTTAIAVPDEGPLSLVTATATNTGFRPIKLTGANAVTDDGRSVFCHFVTWGGPQPLPVVLSDGESVQVWWRQADLDSVKAEDDSFQDLHTVKFTDAQGRDYVTPYPGFRAHRRLGWRRGPRLKTVYRARKPKQPQ